MGSYTVAAIAAPLAVVALELLVLRTGLWRRARFWIAMAIVLGFQVPVDGWLTKPGGTIVHYDPQVITGIRLWNMPIEDFGFGFALVALTILLWGWHQQRARHRFRPPPPGYPVGKTTIRGGHHARTRRVAGHHQTLAEEGAGDLDQSARLGRGDLRGG